MTDGEMRSRKQKAADEDNKREARKKISSMSTQELFFFLENAPKLPLAIEGIDECAESVTFSAKLSEYLKERSMSAAELGKAALLSRSFTYQLCSGTRMPGRDIVLRVALVLGLTLEETQYLLRSAQRGALYPRIRRDAIIIWCIGKHLDLFDTDEQLASSGEETLL